LVAIGQKRKSPPYSITLVGDHKQRRRINAERPCDLEIDDKFELDRLVDRQVGKLGTFEKLTDANGENAILPSAVAGPP
jgi:hypothetical protein